MQSLNNGFKYGKDVLKELRVYIFYWQINAQLNVAVLLSWIITTNQITCLVKQDN